MLTLPSHKELKTAIEWIIHSPNLLVLDATWNFPNDFSDGIVSEVLDSELEQISEWLATSKVRLGRLFERLVLAAFEAHSEYEVLERSIDIFEGKRQLTELDFIIRKPDGGILHLEVSVKFYLYISVNGMYQISGSDGKDVIDERLMKFDRQLREGMKYTQEHYPNDRVESRILSKGRLFEERGGKHCEDPLIHPDSERGEWTFDTPDGDEHPFKGRWNWISWPPEPSSETIVRLEGELHAWKEGPKHIIFRRNA
ncbi:DUF1853 family protein [Phaeocystidibacter marisrubri]|uniref:DUF1853 family protein n=1 Tax=Phaeocystidibacter marisrubri TaxID=1577780 RepID=A0A6L3ZE86_9FLAO|nr:DUF1853 family protein [Phaeocystidibacter marisrubri]KAB2816145.1 DUF1853 family protein [Phaeocystidibacter marisrubri]GGH67557.1 hypothetical protein GCM10011318_06650 [Phaeocystidibacter marisrubri]